MMRPTRRLLLIIIAMPRSDGEPAELIFRPEDVRIVRTGSAQPGTRLISALPRQSACLYPISR